MVACRHCGTANQTEKVVCVKCKRELIDPAMAGKIACVNHANKEATATCGQCASLLCERCAHALGEQIFCEGCAPEGAISPEHDQDYEVIPVLHVEQQAIEHASLGTRFGAMLVDIALFLALAGVLAVILAMFTGGTLRPESYRYLTNVMRPQFWIYWLVLPIGFLAYHTLMVAMSGQTVGKQLAGVIVLDSDGMILETKQALKRALGQLLSLLPAGLGFLWALWDGNHETWHDKLAQTVAFRYQDTT
jgi:uncharacterized RDD family membrane protein YckC